jgi:MFS family permease
MITLRLFSLFVGGLVLVVPPMVLFDAGAGGMPAWIVAGGLLGVVLMACSFFYVGVAGNKMRRPGRARMLGGALLLLPVGASMLMLATYDDETVLWSSGLLLVFTIILILSCVFPRMLDPRQRPMRRRERQEPVILHLHRG